jgi:putative membrane protein
MVALLITAVIIPGVAINSIWAGLFAAFILGIVNGFIKPVFTFLTLPLTILTLGLFLLVVNGLMLMIVAVLVPGFTVSGLFYAIIGSVVLSILSGWMHKVI